MGLSRDSGFSLSRLGNRKMDIGFGLLKNCMGIKRLGSLDDFMPKLGVFAAFSGDDDFGSEIGSGSKSESGIRISGGRSGMSDWLRNGREWLPVKLKTKRGNRTG